MNPCWIALLMGLSLFAIGLDDDAIWATGHLFQ